MQTIWFLSKPWPHLGGLRELVGRVAFHFESDAPQAPRKKVVEGCAAAAVPEAVDEAGLARALDAAEAAAMELPMAEVLPWRQAMAQKVADPVASHLLSLAAADAGLRVLGLPFARGFPLVWEVAGFARGPIDPVAEWLAVEAAAEGEAVIPGIVLQQRLALAQAQGMGTVRLCGPWDASLTHIPQRESAMMAQFHGDVYSPGPQGPCAGGAGLVHAASVAAAPGLGYAQTVETHRRFGIGRLRGR